MDPIDEEAPAGANDGMQPPKPMGRGVMFSLPAGAGVSGPNKPLRGMYRPNLASMPVKAQNKPKKIKLLWDGNRCVHCARCVRSCPEKAVYFVAVEGSSRRVLVQDDDKCTTDMSCTSVCPAGAITYEVLEQ